MCLPRYLICLYHIGEHGSLFYARLHSKKNYLSALFFTEGWFRGRGPWVFLSGDPITWNKGGVGHAASGSMEEYFRRSNSLERQTYWAKINHSHNYNPPNCQDVVLHDIILPSRGSVLNSMWLKCASPKIWLRAVANPKQCNVGDARAQANINIHTIPSKISKKKLYQYWRRIFRNIDILNAILDFIQTSFSIGHP